MLKAWSHTPILYYAYKRLASSIVKSFTLSAWLCSFSIQFNLRLPSFLFVYFSFDKWWMPTRPSKRRPPLPQAHSLTHSHTCILPAKPKLILLSNSICIDNFIEIRKLCAICHPILCHCKNFGLEQSTVLCRVYLMRAYTTILYANKSKTNIRSFVRWSRE